MLKIPWKLTQGEVTAGPEDVRSLAYLLTVSKGYAGAEGREVAPTMTCYLPPSEIGSVIRQIEVRCGPTYAPAPSLNRWGIRRGRQ